MEYEKTCWERKYTQINKVFGHDIVGEGGQLVPVALWVS